MSQLKNDKEIQSYYNSTHFEYQLIWNWNLKTTPALHFGYYDEKATKHAQAIFRINEVLADWADIKEGTTVLDAGCGLGNFLFNSSIIQISFLRRFCHSLQH